MDYPRLENLRFGLLDLSLHAYTGAAHNIYSIRIYVVVSASKYPQFSLSVFFNCLFYEEYKCVKLETEEKERKKKIPREPHSEGNYKRLFEQFFERMSDLTRNHVEAELCFDLSTRMMINIMQYK